MASPSRLAPVLLALSLAACAGGGAEVRACAEVRADTAGWRRVERAGVSLLVPPEFAPDSAAGGGEAWSWAVAARGGGAASARITLQRGPAIPGPAAEGGDAGLREREECRLPAAPGRPGAEVETAWLEDALSPTGRSHQAVARWTPPPGGGPATGLFLVSETPEQHQRLLAVLHSVRLR